MDKGNLALGNSERPAEQNTAPVERMDPALKAKWLAALRSGEYRQCRGVLHDGGSGYCCLGVLSLLMGHDRAAIKGLESNGPEDVRVAVVGDPGRLADMNDGTGDQVMHTFPEIADWIEENL